MELPQFIYISTYNNKPYNKNTLQIEIFPEISNVFNVQKLFRNHGKLFFMHMGEKYVRSPNSVE